MKLTQVRPERSGKGHFTGKDVRVVVGEAFTPRALLFELQKAHRKGLTALLADGEAGWVQAKDEVVGERFIDRVIQAAS